MANNSTNPSPVLPTLDKLGAKVPDSASATDIAQEWLSTFSSFVEKEDIAAVEHIFLADAFWRDLLALTSDARTFHGWKSIRPLLDSRRGHLLNLKLLQEPHNLPQIDSPFPDLTLLQFAFGFETPIGQGTGIGRLVPGSDGKWRGYTVFTCLDSLTNSVEKVRNC